MRKFSDDPEKLLELCNESHWAIGRITDLESQLVEARAEIEAMAKALRAGHSGLYWETKRNEVYQRWQDALIEIERLKAPGHSKCDWCQRVMSADEPRYIYTYCSEHAKHGKH